MTSTVATREADGAPRQPGHRAVSMDGGLVFLRPVLPEDRTSLDDLFLRLSVRSSFQRFMTGSRALAGEYVTELYDESRTLDAVVVLSGGRVVAVGSTHPTSENAAEVALVIDDDHQGHGLGTLLLEDLVERARRRGLRQLVALISSDNHQIRQVLTDVGVPVHFEQDGTSCDVTLDIATGSGLDTARAGRERIAAARSLEPLLRPQSLVIVGADTGTGSLSRRLALRARKAGYAGSLGLVGPAVVDDDGELPGVEYYGRIDDLPDRVDLAILAMPTSSVVQGARDCVRAGVRALAILDSTASVADGAAVRDEVLAVCRDAGIRCLGPGSFGLANTAPGVNLDASLLPVALRPGVVSLVAASWGVAISVATLLDLRGIGLSTLVHVGEEGDVSVSDVVSHAIADPHTSVVVGCVQREDDLIHVRHVAATTPGKEVVGFASPQPPVAPALGDGGALVRPVAPSRRRSGTQPSGLVEVEALDELVDVVEVLVKQRRPRGPRTAVFCNSEALGAITLEAIAGSPLLPASLTQHSDSRLRFLLPSGSRFGTLVSAGHSATISQLSDALETLAEDPGVDAIVVAVSPPALVPWTDVVAMLDHVSARHPQTVVVSVVNAPSQARPLRVPAIEDPSRAVRLLATLVTPDASSVTPDASSVTPGVSSVPPDASSTRRGDDEVAALRRLEV